MKKEGHPEYVACEIHCACGSIVKTRATTPIIKLDICSACHPFYTGKQKLIDTAGRIEKFQRRYQKSEEKQAAVKANAEAAKVKAAQAPAPKAKKGKAKV